MNLSKLINELWRCKLKIAEDKNPNLDPEVRIFDEMNTHTIKKVFISERIVYIEYFVQ